MPGPGRLPGHHPALPGRHLLGHPVRPDALHDHPGLRGLAAEEAGEEPRGGPWPGREPKGGRARKREREELKDRQRGVHREAHHRGDQAGEEMSEFWPRPKHSIA